MSVTGIYPPMVALVVTVLLTRFMLSNRLARKLQDVPNDRSLHSTPVPRTGSVGLIAGILSGWMLMPDALPWWVVWPALGLFAVSLLDDIHHLSVRQRLLSHLIAALLMVGGAGLLAQQGWVIAVFVLFVVVWMTNLYNFMDGSDGLAGGMGVIGFGVMGVAAWLANDSSLALMNFCIAAAAAGFLYFNLQPAKIFMGDAGSIPLGFLVAAMGVWGWQHGSWAAWFPVMVFSPFVVDASVTLLKRMLRGARVTEAHREHYYQRLIQLGWGHRKVALAEYILMLTAGTSAVWMQHSFVWLFFALASVYAALMLLVDVRWNKFIQDKNV